MKALFATALSLFLLAAPSGAQELLATSDDAPTRIAAVDPPLVPASLVRALASSSEDTRADAMHRMLTLVYDSPEGVDLAPAIPALLSIYQADPDARHRAFALRCLEASASEDVMSTLRAEANHESDPAVKRLLFSVLVDHYGAADLRGDARVEALARSIQADLQG